MQIRNDALYGWDAEQNEATEIIERLIESMSKMTKTTMITQQGRDHNIFIGKARDIKIQK